MIEDEGVHAIVGPNSSADSLLVVGAAAPSGLAVTGARPVAGLLQGGAAARCRPGVLLPFAGLDQPLSALDLARRFGGMSLVPPGEFESPLPA